MIIAAIRAAHFFFFVLFLPRDFDLCEIFLDPVKLGGCRGDANE